MADAIYRKYRPKTFADVTDQSHVVTTVSNQLKSGSVSHAYLFVGPRGVGKTTIARLLAKSVNCEKRKTGQAEPCNECSACVSIGSGSCLDVAEIDAASHTGVDHVREGIIESARFRPSSAKMKVFIIDEVHMLSASAFNALLKTLEEPPEHVLFILATTEAHKIPETIISRCQRFDFRRVPAESIAKCLKDICKLEKIEVDDDVLSEIARRSDGALRDAQSMLSQVFALGSKKITMDEASLVFPANDAKMQFALLNAISANDSALAIRLLNEYSDSGVDIADFTEHLQNIVRDILFIQLGGLEQFRGKYDSASEKELSKIAEKFERNVLTSFLRALPSASKNASNSAIPQLALELLILDVLNGSSNNKNFSADDDGGGPANSSGGSDLSNQNAEKQEKQKKPESNANPRPRLGSAPASPRLDRG
ncbi:TPA: DNA polymerase III subunit gamma/tau, partial [Candidatus Uhrbacteria bacterium]|nr:DNA polymerase III subunit gamma/tau [Candidatus Uhrbacteria bacterium]